MEACLLRTPGQVRLLGGFGLDHDLGPGTGHGRQTQPDLRIRTGRHDQYGGRPLPHLHARGGQAQLLGAHGNGHRCGDLHLGAVQRTGFTTHVVIRP